MIGRRTDSGHNRHTPTKHPKYDRAVEIGLEAECFGADLVVIPLAPRRSPVGWLTGLTRRLLAGRPDAEIDVLHVSALRAQPIG